LSLRSIVILSEVEGSLPVAMHLLPRQKSFPAPS
jgi:hypothetical protein